MAFYDEEKEEDQVGQGPQTTGPQSGVVGADGAQQAAPSNGAAPAPGASAAAPKREPFVGISEYINANKPQSEKLAGQVAGNINTKAQGVDTALSGAQNSFNQAADSQKVNADQGVFGAVASDARSVANDKDKAGQFGSYLNAGYTGPQKIEDVDQGNAWAGIQSALQKAKDAKTAAGTEAGRMGLIKEISNNPRQSQGGLVFDNLLLQSNPNAAGMLQNAGSNLNDIDQRLSQADTDAAARAKSVADSNAAVKAQASGAINQGYNNLYGASAGADGKYGTADDQNLNLANSLTGRVSSTQEAQKKAYSELQSRLTSGKLTAADYKVLGIAPGTNTYGTKLGNYVAANPNANVNNVATMDDYDKMAALSALAGAGGPGYLDPTKSQIGKASPGYTANQAGLQSKIVAAKQDYTNKFDKLAQDAGNQNIYNEKGIRQFADWMLEGKDPGGFTPAALQDFIKSDVGQKVAQLASQYGYKVPTKTQGGTTNPNITGSLSTPMLTPVKR